MVRWAPGVIEIVVEHNVVVVVRRMKMEGSMSTVVVWSVVSVTTSGRGDIINNESKLQASGGDQ